MQNQLSIFIYFAMIVKCFVMNLLYYFACNVPLSNIIYDLNGLIVRLVSDLLICEDRKTIVRLDFCTHNNAFLTSFLWTFILQIINFQKLMYASFHLLQPSFRKYDLCLLADIFVMGANVMAKRMNNGIVYHYGVTILKVTFYNRYINMIISSMH